MTGFYIAVLGQALLGALIALLLVPRWPIVRAAAVFPVLCLLIALPVAAYRIHQSSWDGGWGHLAGIVVLMCGGGGAAASFAFGLMAAALRLRYLRHR